MQPDSNIIITPEQVLKNIPQQKPFRFIDEVIEINDTSVLGKYTFKTDEFFYAGHFPGNPVTPGVILLEALAQTGVVALGIYLWMKSNSFDSNLVTLFTDAEVEFLSPVYPGKTVWIKGEKIFFRHNKLKSKVTMRLEDNTLVAEGTLSGMGVRK